ncbi:hypothetical protein ACF0H5_023693 [Mactra antiquata]
MRQASPTAVCRAGSGVIEERKTLNECVYKNDVEGVKESLNTNVMAWNTKNTSGLTPLMVASTLNRTEILDILLSSKCDVNVTDDNGNTALHLAVDEGNTEVVKKLIETGRCIVDAMNNKGETALMKAAFYDYVEMVRSLLKDGSASPDVKNKAGQTALLIAIREGSHATVDLLLKNGCDVRATDTLGQSALYMAVHSPCNKTLDLAKRLISAGYNCKIDKMWLLHDEKHNLFYQDDEFYAALRRHLRSNSSEVKYIATSGRKISASGSVSSPFSPTSLSPKETSPTSPPFAMSPTLKQKIMSPKSSKFPSIPFSQMKSPGKPDIELNPPRSSPLASRRGEYKKAASFEQTTPVSRCLRPPFRSSFSSDSDESPIGSPILKPRLMSQQSDQSSNGVVMTAHASSTTTTSAFEKKNTNIQRSTTFSTPSSTKPLYIRDDDKKSNSAPGSPIIRYKRQLSTQPVSGSESDLNRRKISLPNKTVVQFSTEIKIIEYNNRQ